MFTRANLILILLAISLLVWTPLVGWVFKDGNSSFVTNKKTETDLLRVTFFDVGQGDAIHILTPDGYEMLVDGGPDGGILKFLSAQRSFFDRNIDVMVATHSDLDHVSGLSDVLRRYQVGVLLYSNAGSDKMAATVYRQEAKNRGVKMITAHTGQLIKLGASTTVEILSPKYDDTTKWNTNSASVVLRVVYGQVSFLLTGDAPVGIERYLVKNHNDRIKSKILKLGHHGSDTSSSHKFLEAVKPDLAIVSAGKNNRYNHPHAVVIDRVSNLGIKILNTAEIGTINIYTNGINWWVEND